MFVKKAGAWIWVGGLAAPASGGSVNIKQIEVWIGGTPKMYHEEPITDADVTATSQIMATQAYGPTLGGTRDADEQEMEPLHLFAKNMAAGSFTLVLVALEGPIHEFFLVNYLVG